MDKTISVFPVSALYSSLLHLFFFHSNFQNQAACCSCAYHIEKCILFYTMSSPKMILSPPFCYISWSICCPLLPVPVNITVLQISHFLLVLYLSTKTLFFLFCFPSFFSRSSVCGLSAQTVLPTHIIWYQL